MDKTQIVMALLEQAKIAERGSANERAKGNMNMAGAYSIAALTWAQAAKLVQDMT